MRLDTPLSIALLVVAIIAVVPPIHAESYGAWISVSPDHGHRGVDIYVYGYNFTVGSTVYIYFDDKLIDTMQADWDGWIGGYVEIPVDAKPGTHVIKAVDQQGVQALTTFTVTTPTLYLNTTDAEPYSVIRVTGSGYAAYQWYLVAIDGLVADSFVMARGNETLDATVAVPPLPGGEHHITIVYVSLATGNHVAVASKTITVKNGYVDNQTFTQAINKVWAEINKLDKTAAALQNKLGQLVEKIRALETIQDELAANLTSLQGRLDKIAEEIWGTINTINNTLTSLENLVMDLSRNQTALEKLFTEKIADTTARLDNEITMLNNTITTLRTTLEEKPWINYTDTQLEKAQEALAVLKTRLNNIAGHINSLDNTTATQITMLKNRIDRLENTIAAMNKTIKAQQESLKTLSDRLRLYSSLYAALIAAIAVAATVLAIIVKKKQH